jgi:uncharacterized membrane protein YuzA (DUF378 family)
MRRAVGSDVDSGRAVVQLITRSIKIYCSLRWGVFGFIPFELTPQLLEILQLPL